MIILTCLIVSASISCLVKEVEFKKHNSIMIISSHLYRLKIYNMSMVDEKLYSSYKRLLDID